MEGRDLLAAGVHEAGCAGATAEPAFTRRAAHRATGGVAWRRAAALE